jgi:hypothetical protein
MSLRSAATEYEMRRPVSFWMLAFGASAAPIAWLAQVMLSYGITAYACYPGDHPQMIASATLLRAIVYVVDAVAVLLAVGGGLVSWHCFRKMPGRADAPAPQSRARFLAVWGIFSSQWFLGAIIFGVIASVSVPPCAG